MSGLSETTRRNFLLGAVAASGIGAVRAAESRRPGGCVRFCAFADMHYQPHLRPNDNVEFLEKVLLRAERENVDFIIHLGDLCHNVLRDHEYLDLYNDFHIPTYHVMGNHDGEMNDNAWTLKAYRLEKFYYSFDRCGFRFIVGDPNYMRTLDDKDLHYEKYNVVSTKRKKAGYFPDEQVAWIRKTIMESPYPCVFFSHQSVERETGGVANWREIRDIFDEANRREPGKVRMVINGHYHLDNFRMIRDVAYLDLNSACCQYYPKPHKAYPEDYVKTHPSAPYFLAWEEPLSAIVTLTADGGIKIDGSESEYLFGITPAKAGVREGDPCGRITTARIESVDLKVNFGRRSS